MDFLGKIDSIYKNIRDQFEGADDAFGCFIEVEPIDQKTTLSFIIKKREKSMLLIVDGKQRVHMSDLQIINCICDMSKVDRDWFLQQFIDLYKGQSSKIKFKISGEEFEGCGITHYPETKALELYSDTVVDYNDFVFLLNFIFSKDKCHEDRKKIPAFSKQTLVKYITLIDYYGNNGLSSKQYLEAIGYPVHLKHPVDNKSTAELFTDIKGFDISAYL